MRAGPKAHGLFIALAIIVMTSALALTFGLRAEGVTLTKPICANV
jgi:hypothetical protein